MIAQRRDAAAERQRREAATCNPRPIGADGLAIPPHRVGLPQMRYDIRTARTAACGILVAEQLLIPQTGRLDASARVPAPAGRAAARAPRGVLAHGEDH